MKNKGVLDVAAYLTLLRKYTTNLKWEHLKDLETNMMYDIQHKFIEDWLRKQQH
jgi:hypothetical protein